MRGKGGGIQKAGVFGQQSGGIFKKGGVTSAAKKKLPSGPTQLPSMRATGHEPTFRGEDRQTGRWGRPNSQTPPHGASISPASPSSVEEDNTKLPPQPNPIPPTATHVNRSLPGGAVWGSKSWSQQRDQQVMPPGHVDLQQQPEQPQHPPLQPQQLPQQQQQAPQPQQQAPHEITEWAEDDEEMDFTKELPSNWGRDKDGGGNDDPDATLVKQMQKAIEKRKKEEEEMNQAKESRIQEKLAAIERRKKATQGEASELAKKKLAREEYEVQQDELMKRKKQQEALKKEWTKAQVSQRKAAIEEIKRQRTKLADGPAPLKRVTQRVTAPVDGKQEMEKEKEEEHSRPNGGKGAKNTYEHEREDYWHDRKGGEKGGKKGYDHRRGGGRGNPPGNRSNNGPRGDLKQGGKGDRYGHDRGGPDRRHGQNDSHMGPASSFPPTKDV